MKIKCCGKILIPKINIKASVLDFIGLSFFLSFFLSILWFVLYLATLSFLEELSNGTLFEPIEAFGFELRNTPFIFFALFVTYKLLPKFLHACSFFINYRIKIFNKCRVCQVKSIILDLPTDKEPF
ncbi:hypothetical protein [Marinicellulosiphila megalodicopiae]|uniref:hypothetical protein n=1 Tax=Marinicellulosiphila megalodicopiae TaxID=2724896 RepID=UPI003BB0D7D5